MKKILHIFILAALAVVFASCAGNKGVDLTDAEAVAGLRDRIAEHVPADASVVYVGMFPADHFMNIVRLVNVTYFPAEGGDPITYAIYLDGAAESKTDDAPFSYKRMKAEDGVSLADIDFSVIPGYLSQAGKMLEEEGYTFSGIDNYVLHVNSDPAKTRHEFCIESKGDSKMTTRGGQLTQEISYYETNFRVGADGEIEMLD